MVGNMAKIDERGDNNDLVVRAKTDSEALGRLYDLYYERIYRFCLYRLFVTETAEDVTSMVFLTVARKIHTFEGATQKDFCNWLYAIAVNHSNSYIRKTARRKKLFEKIHESIVDKTNCSEDIDWPRLYQAISKLKPQHQAIVTLRFFENMDYEQIGKITNARPGTVRVKLHRILEKLKADLTVAQKGANGNV
jgi:RNA polymerase sigma-70 factor (ECF subfamily)